MNNPHLTLYDVSMPVGSVISFVGKIQKYKADSTPEQFSTQPESNGWMVCDGSPLNASQYPELYAALGGLYGTSGSGSEMTFNLPDMSGQFLRGIGTDAASTEKRTSATNGTATGVGSTQKDAFQSHEHNYTESIEGSVGSEGAAFTEINPEAFTGLPTSSTDPTSIKTSTLETRSTNVFVYYLIKYTYKLPKYSPQNLQFKPE